MYNDEKDLIIILVAIRCKMQNVTKHYNKTKNKTKQCFSLESKHFPIRASYSILAT